MSEWVIGRMDGWMNGSMNMHSQVPLFDLFPNHWPMNPSMSSVWNFMQCFLKPLPGLQAPQEGELWQWGLVWRCSSLHLPATTLKLFHVFWEKHKTHAGYRQNKHDDTCTTTSFPSGFRINSNYINFTDMELKTHRQRKIRYTYQKCSC